MKSCVYYRHGTCFSEDAPEPGRSECIGDCASFARRPPTATEWRELVRPLIEAVDDLNAARATPKDLCLLCGSNAYGAMGIEHTSTCVLDVLRRQLEEL
jgi:hypothetical protein